MYQGVSMNISDKKRFRSAYSLLISLFLFTLFFRGTWAATQTIETISPQQAAALILKEKDNHDFVILDIRTPPEFQNRHLKNAILLNYYSSTFISRLEKLDKNKIYLVYCRSGNRSGKALAVFNQLGFKHVYNMAQGIRGWEILGYPVIK
jgi:rhodanese-related sulfurtransferase